MSLVCTYISNLNKNNLRKNSKLQFDTCKRRDTGIAHLKIPLFCLWCANKRIYKAELMIRIIVYSI